MKRQLVNRNGLDRFVLNHNQSEIAKQGGQQAGLKSCTPQSVTASPWCPGWIIIDIARLRPVQEFEPDDGLSLSNGSVHIGNDYISCWREIEK